MVYQTEATRETILRIATALFLERGFHHTQMQEVAAAIGISRNTLYRYYQDKGDLGLAILEIAVARVADSMRDALSRLERAGNAHANARERLQAILTAVMLGGERDAELRFIAELEAYSVREGKQARRDTPAALSTWMLVEDHLVSVIEAGNADGSIRADIDVRYLIWTVLTSFWVLQKDILAREKAALEPHDARLAALLPTWITLVSDGLKPQS